MLDSPRFANGFEDFSPRSFIKMVSGKNITVGSNVWVEDNELAWIEAEVLHVFEEEVKVITRKGKRLHMPLCKVHPRDPATENGIEDMTRLYYLSEPEVLCNLAKRYEQNNIYTYSGKILIAINPFTQLPHLYNLDMMDKYRRATFGQLSPHVFAVADSAYRAMISKKHSQSILVSGESGAGKTETTKLIMQYLAYIGGSSRADNRRVEQQILKSNTLLEAFGNARTTRNNNSSRFGKFVQIQFDKSGRISGAAIRTYLLERSRVVQIAKPERNYHCFYQLCASPEASKKYKLGDPKTLHYLNNSNTYGLSEISDADDYIGTRNAMHVVGIGFSEQEAIFQTLAGILHLGNIEFCCGKENDSSMPKDMDSCFHLQCAAELLGCDAKHLEDTLCRHGIVSPEGVIIKELDSSTAATNRDALAKTIYIRLFEWLVAKINASIGQDTNSKFQIGVLDIYGFESFENNSFEQFCINFANEKLQQHFNLHVFKMEQENYSKEHIDWSHISFVDNQDVVDLIEKKHSGIIAFLDDCCKFPKSTSQTLASKLYHAFKDHDRFRMRTESLTRFTILHYAGEVIYQMDNFLEKNKDYVVLEHHNLLSTSKCSFVAGLFLPTVLDTSKSSFKFSSVASQFKEQLQALVNTLSCTEPHYVRCVKPNSDNKPWEFDNLSVLHQLRCGGVLEAIRISCAGYPTRCTYDKFLDRFGFLAPEITNGCYDTKIATEKLLQKYNIQNYQLGRSMVFLRAAQMAELDCQRSEMLNGASRLIQCRWQTFVARKIFLRIYEAAICIQAFSRGCLARRFCESRRRERGAILIQKNSRRYLQRRTYIWLCSAAVSIQSAMRSSLCQKQFYQKKVSAIAIQKTWRMQKTLAIYHKLCASSITLQCAWRQLVAKRRLQRLKAVQSSITLQCAWRQLVAKRKLQRLKAVHTQEFEKLEMMKLHNALHDIREQLDVAVLNFSKEQEKTQIIQSLLESTLMERKHRFQTNLEKIFNLKKQNEDLKALAASLHRKKVEFEIELKKSRAIFDEWQKRK